MRKIQINRELVARVEDFYSKPFKNRNQKFKLPLKRLDDLTKTSGFRSGRKSKYIKELIEKYDKIVLLKPSEFQTWIDHFEAILPNSSKDFTPKFSKAVVDALAYEDLREKELLSLYKNLNIKACCYCNAQLTIVANVEFYEKPRKKKGLPKKRKATFELDHYFPKSKYPFLATTFFNLFPSCSNCNKSKSDKTIGFNLFEESNKLDLFHFEFDRTSEPTYWKTMDPKDLEFSFKAINVDDEDLKIKFNEMFSIEGIYETQKDIIEYLIHIRDAYSKGYKAGLIDLAEKKLFSDEAMIKKMLIGNYFDPEDVHKRPLAKFTQDIARQLKLI
jgi:hypothetical protein